MSFPGDLPYRVHGGADLLRGGEPSGAEADGPLGEGAQGLVGGGGAVEPAAGEDAVLVRVAGESLRMRISISPWGFREYQRTLPLSSFSPASRLG